jgi:uncharacterized protein (TIGR02246 family)
MTNDKTTAEDERAIRDLLAAWHRATALGDAARLRPLMADDVIFLTAGQPPMRGVETFIASFQQVIQQMQIDSSGEIQELQIMGEWAYCWSHLQVNITARADGATRRRSGDVLSILRKQADQSWVITRDANLLTLEV